MASTQLNKSVQKNAGNDNITKMTFSAWIKRTALGEGTIIAAHQLSTYYTHFYFNSDNRIQIYSYINSSTAANLVTERQFTDTNGWYHIVFTIDTTLGTSTDRMKIYVNGERITTFNGGTTFPAQNSSFGQFSDTGATLNIGNTANRGAFSGLMSHVHYTPYTAYDASAFGSTDSTTGEWQINTAPNVTYSTAGFFILKDGNSVTDQSGNSNNFTVGAGTLTKTEDNPSNVFDTINTNFAKTGGVNGRDSNIRVFIDNGATRLSTDVALWTTMLGSISMFSGKYYWECKRTVEGSPSNQLAYVGIEPLDTAGTTLGSPVGTNTNAISYHTGGSVNKSNSSQSGTWASWQSNNDIVQVAIDMDNYFIYFGKNGTWQNSGDPTSGGSGTGGIAILAGKGYVNGFTTHRGGGSAGGDKSMLKMNFGNGYFQTTAVASAGTNASGNGIFEYDVPAGYTALSTKGLNL